MSFHHIRCCNIPKDAKVVSIIPARSAKIPDFCMKTESSSLIRVLQKW